MHLDKLFGSKTKVDIIKYLLFKRQWVSVRALEHEIPWTFPAIKKQIDSLELADVIFVDKDKMKWSIFVKPDIMAPIKTLFLHYLTHDLKKIFSVYEVMIEKFYFWQIFWNTIDVDLILIHKNMEKEPLDRLREEINSTFRDYFIDSVAIVCMSADEFQKRYRLADKFVLNLMRNLKM